VKRESGENPERTGHCKCGETSGQTIAYICEKVGGLKMHKPGDLPDRKNGGAPG